MSKPHTILLVPPQGSTLLSDVYAPLAWRHPRRDVWHFSDTGHRPHIRALVLARAGKVQRHGCLTLAETRGPMWYPALDEVARHVQDALEGKPEWLEAFVSWLPGARLIYLDLMGKECE